MKLKQLIRVGYGERGCLTPRSTEYRRVMKPLLERKRRARINSCLEELKMIISDLAHMNISGLNKLEKADILELAVHLLQDQRSIQASAQQLESIYWCGFRQCAQQVSSYLQQHDKTLGEQFDEFLQQIMQPAAKPAPQPLLWRPW